MQAIAASLSFPTNKFLLITKRDVSFVSVLMGLCQPCHTDRTPRAELLLSKVVQELPRLELEQQRSQFGLQNLFEMLGKGCSNSPSSYSAALFAGGTYLVGRNLEKP